jgi:hypothetical protein
MEGVIRPEAVVLPENAVVPDKNLISPAPNKFTHQLIRSQPYYFSEARQGRPPDGEFPAGTKVVLLVHDRPFCRVVDGQGLYVQVGCDSLKKL